MSQPNTRVASHWHDSISTAADSARDKVLEVARATMAMAQKEGHRADIAVGQFWAKLRDEIGRLGQ